ncbi:MAG: phospholipid carrier-dependent glycosyltransferase [Candidatus Taylorbacteria bacterium]|nr:phospholipid carrier-dependent glycosyltransferase [Candidatus Taylorbacteria bacterium]
MHHQKKHKAHTAHKKANIFLILVVATFVISIFFRFWNLSSDEIIFDEGIYAFRSIGYLDYMESSAQITPIQMFVDKEMPGWLTLSFHDAPPLFFLISHIFFTILGESILVARLPSALAGLGIVILMFFLTRRIFEKLENEKLRLQKEWAGLLSSAITAISFASVAFSRLSQLEALLFFFILLNIYFFLKLVDEKKWWWAFGITFGTCILIKYTAVFLIPVYFIYLIIIRSKLIRDWRFYAGWGISGILFLPVIIYNIKLYGLLGHFDLQFSYLFGQSTPEWHGISGGKNQAPFSEIISNISLIYSVPFILFSIVGIVLSLTQKTLGKVRWFMLLNFAFILLLLTAVGSAIRFISTLIIPSIFFITLAIIWSIKFHNGRKIVTAITVLFLIYEGYFSTSLLFINRADYGIVKLDKYFDLVFGETRPSGLPRHPNQNLNKIIEKYSSNRQVKPGTVGIVFDDRISDPAHLWLFSRRQFYNGIPVMPASAFLEIFNKSGAGSLKDFHIYFVRAGEATTISEITDQNYHKSLESFLSKIPKESKFTIKTDDQRPTFEVAEFIF